MQTNIIYNGDSLATLSTLPSESVQTCVTSPPYYGLRDYGTAKWEGGDVDCDHKKTALVGKASTLRTDGRQHTGPYNGNVTDEKSRQRCLAENKVARGLVGRFRHGLKPKDLIGIPWKVAFALQADGWYLRQDIIWAKPNPMPESVRDRCTKAHEYVFLLSKSQRYYYDADAVAEPALSRAINETRNRRSVWTVTPKPFKEAHFAVMPEALVEPCILAGSRPGDLVLDPFSGAGTVAAVAKANNRRYIGIDLNTGYCKIARERIAKVSAKPLLQAA